MDQKGKMLASLETGGDMRKAVRIPRVKLICNLEQDDTFYPEQPVALYDGGVLKGCGFAVEKDGFVRVYRSLLHGRVANVPLDSGVDVTPLRAERRVLFDEESVSGHPYKGAWGYR